MKTLRIDITAFHIAAGVRYDPERCPAALAVQDAAGTESVDVDLDVIHFRGLDCRVTLPPEAQRFVRRFDDGAVVKPFAFPIPDPRPEVAPA